MNYDYSLNNKSAINCIVCTKFGNKDIRCTSSVSWDVRVKHTIDDVDALANHIKSEFAYYDHLKHYYPERKLNKLNKLIKLCSHGITFLIETNKDKKYENRNGGEGFFSNLYKILVKEQKEQEELIHGLYKRHEH